MLLPLRGRVYILFPWTWMISSNNRILKWCYLTSDWTIKVHTTSAQNIQNAYLWMFPFGTLLRNPASLPGDAQDTWRGHMPIFGQQVQGSILFSPGSRHESRQASRCSKWSPRCGGAEIRHLLLLGQNLDPPTLSITKFLLFYTYFRLFCYAAVSNQIGLCLWPSLSCHAPDTMTSLGTCTTKEFPIWGPLFLLCPLLRTLSYTNPFYTYAWLSIST